MAGSFNWRSCPRPNVGVKKGEFREFLRDEAEDYKASAAEGGKWNGRGRSSGGRGRSKCTKRGEDGVKGDNINQARSFSQGGSRGHGGRGDAGGLERRGRGGNWRGLIARDFGRGGPDQVKPSTTWNRYGGARGHSTTGRYRPQRPKALKLRDWQTQPADVIVLNLNSNNQSNLQEFLADDVLSTEDMCLFVKVLSIATTSDSSRQGVLDILITVFSEEFISKLIKFQMTVYNENTEDLKTFFHDQHQLLYNFFKSLPLSALDKIPELIQTSHLILQKHVQEFPEQELGETCELYTKLVEHFNKYLEMKRKDGDRKPRRNLADKLSILDSVNPGDDFREIALEPTHDDILAPSQPFVRRNIVKGRYTDVNTYLDVQFRLLREDFIRPLREGVNDYINQAPVKNQNVRIYKYVRVVQSDIIRGKLIYYLKLNFPKKFKLETSKRLMFGNLICASNDNFTSFFLALIADKQEELLRQGIIGITPLSNSKISFSTTYTVVESTAFFVAYKHVLAALQRMNIDNFPLAEHIVFVQGDIDKPNYLKERPNSVYDLSVIVENSNYDKRIRKRHNSKLYDVPVSGGIEQWPSCEELKLDQSQLMALHAALTSRLAIIQGPPGTGKTFIGLKIVQTLLHNSVIRTNYDKNDSRPPILVVCYTNHALDQFLEGMLTFTDNIVRIGSRSRNEYIQKYQVNEILRRLKRERNLPEYLISANASTNNKFVQAERSFRQMQMELANLMQGAGLLRLSFLKGHGIIPSYIANQLTEASYRKWILPSNEIQCQMTSSSSSIVERNVWENNRPSLPDLTEDGVQTEDQWRDAFELVRQHEQNRVMDDDLRLEDHSSENIQASIQDFQILKTTVHDKMELFNDEHDDAISAYLDDDDDSELIEYQEQNIEKTIQYQNMLKGFRHLAAVPNIDVSSLRLSAEQNIHDLCIHDRCLLYISWKQNLEKNLQFEIFDLQNDLHRISKDLEHDRYQSSSSHLADLISKIGRLQARLKGISTLEGIVDKDVLVSNGIIPDYIAKQIKDSEDYLEWILPKAPQKVCNNIHHCPTWKVWKNTPGKDDVSWKRQDATWKMAIGNLRRHMHVSQCNPSGPYLGEIVSDDPMYEVLMENYDDTLKTLKLLSDRIPHEDCKSWSFKIQNEQERLRRLLSYAKRDVSIFRINENVNVHDLLFEDRCLLYTIWKKKLIKKYREMCRPNEILVHQLAAQLDEVKRSRYLYVARTADVLGMTTTGAAEYHDLIQDLQPKIVVVEEAAEILEAHVVTSLTKRCEHLIMIGDHQQLRPSAAVYELATKYGLETSMFERMIKNGLPYQTLEYQHRMRPEISRLLVPTIYPNLKDHESVLLRPAVRGIGSSVFFFSHNYKEKEGADDNKSHSNPQEAELIVELARHLVLQGYSTNQITVLTPYSGQFFELKQELRKQPECEGMHVTILDNYQGEENDIILLSLVRNNDQGNIGFLKTENRVCVALSRAKQGLYILGNIDQLCQSGPLWGKIKDSLTATNGVGDALLLCCQNHPEEISYVKTAKDFQLNSPEGGCKKPCATSLPRCSHSCPRKCHVDDPTHENFKCKLPCERKCDLGNHGCTAFCWKDCPPCLIQVNVDLPCSHSMKVRCSDSNRDQHCPTLVKKTIPQCKHVRLVECSNNPANAKCYAPCDVRLDCGHACTKSCHIQDDHQHMKYQCYAPCALNNKSCSQEHKCPLKCYEECLSCLEMVKKKANCGHTFIVECSYDMNTFICKIPCKRLLKCMHRCPRKCSEECGGCVVKVERTLPQCGHKAKVVCSSNYTNLESVKCKMSCTKSCKFNHKCKSQCWEICPPCSENVTVKLPCNHAVITKCCQRTKEGLTCTTMVEKEIPNCNHVVNMPCSKDPSKTKCNAPYPVKLDCGHIGMQYCHAQKHDDNSNKLVCHAPCSRNSKNCSQSHKCLLKCHEDCLDCFVKVNKTANCGHKARVSCSLDMNKYTCKMTCKRMLKCGHRCLRKCSEECGGCQVRGKKTFVKCGHTVKVLCDVDASNACGKCNTGR